MQVYQAISKRYSCRSYKNQPIEPEKLSRILDAARQAPSARNMQDWRLVLVTDPALKEKIAVAAREQMFIAEAPVIIVACTTTDYTMGCGQKAGPIDVAIALEHVALQATEEDLATCWIGAFDPEKIKHLLAIPHDVSVIELMPLGYPADHGRRSTKREPIEKIVSYNTWSSDAL